MEGEMEGNKSKKQKLEPPTQVEGNICIHLAGHTNMGTIVPFSYLLLPSSPLLSPYLSYLLSSISPLSLLISLNFSHNVTVNFVNLLHGRDLELFSFILQYSLSLLK
jgi:hypothetical protein